MRLSVADLNLLQICIGQLYEHRTIEEFRKAVCAIMLKAIPADCFAWQTSAPKSNGSVLDYIESDGQSTPKIREVWARTMHLYPFTQYFARTKDPSPLRLSDFISQRQLDEAPHLREALKPVNCRYLLIAATMSRRGTLLGGLNYLRERRDFSERDRTMLGLLRPHAIAARENAEFVSAIIASGPVRNAQDPAQCAEELTEREKEVGQWLALGKTNGEIGVILNASPRTIDKHVERILAKLAVENRTTAALLLRPLASGGAA
ncbi:MAG TPA: LuxR C-terminal-related transcriptional regulator [Verrucomicrobiae bacterium]|jgi:DNA-binding CsgD family transcriptional regulator|nr:LuxR C-terminal-related transcriptional regulator [Verrucomicrobiae bacterium]